VLVDAMTDACCWVVIFIHFFKLTCSKLTLVFAATGTTASTACMYQYDEE